MRPHDSGAHTRADTTAHHGRRWGLWWALAMISTAVGIVTFTSPPVAHAALTPFDPADATVFVAQGSPTRLFKAIPDASGNVAFQPEGAARQFSYNAIAYRSANNLIYAIKTSNAPGDTTGWPVGSIIRIGQGGAPERLGTATIPGANVGAIGGDGFFYAMQGSGTRVDRINPNTGAIANTYTLSAAPGIADFTFAHGYFWSVNASGSMVRLDFSTNSPQMSLFPSPISGTFGAVWTYGNGNIGLSENTTGQVTQLAITDPAGPSPQFTVVSSIPGPASGNNDGTASPGQPTDLAITKSTPVWFTPGSTITFTLSVTNNGPGNASGYTVTDTVPAPLGNVRTSTPGCSASGNTVTCTSNRLVAGASRAIEILADAPASAPVCVTNTATVTANESDPDPANDSASATTCAEPALAVAKSSPTTLLTAVGQPVTYNFAVTNLGAYEITDVVVSDPLVTGITCSPETLAAGQTANCSGTRLVEQADLDAGSVANTATVTGIGPDGPLPPVSSNTVTIPAGQNPQLSLVKATNNALLPEPPGLVTYTFTITNSGNVTLSSPTISDPAVDLSGCVLPATLAPGQSASCTGTHQVTQLEFDAGTLSNVATVTANDPDGTALPPTPSNEVTINGAQRPELTVVKSAWKDDAPVALDDAIAYYVQVINTGNVTVSNIVVSDPLLPLLDCGGVTSLAPGDALLCQGTYIVTQDDVTAGTITNMATVTADDPGGNEIPPAESNEVVVEVEQNPSVSIVKTSTTLSVSAVGQTITYRITVTNTGNVPLTGIEVNDPDADLVNCSGVDPDLELAPGDYFQCQAFTAVTQAHLDAGAVLNTASVSGTTPAGPVEESSNEVRVPAVQSAGLTVEKSAEPTFVEDIGAIVNYSFAVTNTGNVTLDSVNVNDPLLGGVVSCPPGALAPGDTVECTGSRAVDEDDFDNGIVVNVATATATPLGADDPLLPTPSNTVTIAAVQRPELSIVKSSDVSTVDSVGQVIAYELLVSNDGNVTIEGIAVSDPMIPDLECPSDTLTQGTSMTCTGTYTVDADDLDGGTIFNTATVSGIGPDGPLPPVPSNTVTVEVDQYPALTIVKSTDTMTVDALGDEIEYSFLVSNVGNVTVSGISVIDPLVGAVDCPQTSVAIGGSMTCTAIYTVTTEDLDRGSIVNVASVTGSGPQGPATSDPSEPVTVDVDQQPSLAMAKSTSAAPVSAAGQVISYELVVTNSGNVTIDDIVVSDPVADAVTCPATTLALGEAMTCTATYTVTLADMNRGSIANTATVVGTPPAGDPLPAVPSNTVTVGVDQQPGLSVTKSTTSQPQRVGDTMTFEFVVANTGNVSIVDIQVIDTKVPDVTCPRADLDPGQTMRCTGTYTVTALDVEAGAVANVATVVGTDPSGQSLAPVASNEVIVSVPRPAPTPTVPTTPPNVGLPATGAATATILQIVTVLVGLGLGLTFLARRRNAPTS